MNRAVVCLVAVSVSAGACKKRPDAAEERKKVTSTSTDDATQPIVDEDYRFRLAWPGEGWKLLREADARHLNEDAIAGLTNDRVNAIVIVEHAPGGTLAGFADLIIGNIAIEDPKIERSDTTISGEPAVRFEATGTINDLSIEFRGIVLAHQEHIYQVMAFAPKGTARAGELDQPIEAFSLLPGEVKRRTTSVVVEDQVGVGWRVAGGVFESAVSRLRIAPPAGWRLMVGDELARSNTDAEIGLAARDLDAYVIVIDEPIAGGDLAVYRRERLAAMAKTLDVGGKAPGATIAGRPVEMTRAVLAGGVPLEYALGVFGEGDRAYQVMGWYPAALRAKAEPLLAAAFGAIQRMGPDDAATLTRTLEAEADRQVAVGATHALRGGVYRDFANHLRWKKPAHGFWRIYTGQQARARNESALLGADELATGLQSQIFVEPAAGQAADAYHATVVEGLTTAGYHVVRRGEATIAGVPARFTELVSDHAVPIRYRATTAIAGAQGIQVHVWALASTWPEDEALLAAVASGVELAPDLRDVVDAGSLFEDHRLGFAMKLLPGWSMSDITPEAMRAIASIRIWRAHGNEILALGTYAFDQTDDAWLLDLIEQLLRQENASLALGTPVTEPGGLGGREARHVRWDTAAGRMDAYLIKRGAMFYAVLAHDTGTSAATAKRAAAAFELLD